MLIPLEGLGHHQISQNVPSLASRSTTGTTPDLLGSRKAITLDVLDSSSLAGFNVPIEFNV